MGYLLLKIIISISLTSRLWFLLHQNWITRIWMRRWWNILQDFKPKMTRWSFFQGVTLTERKINVLIFQSVIVMEIKSRKKLTGNLYMYSVKSKIQRESTYAHKHKCILSNILLKLHFALFYFVFKEKRAWHQPKRAWWGTMLVCFR